MLKATKQFEITTSALKKYIKYDQLPLKWKEGVWFSRYNHLIYGNTLVRFLLKFPKKEVSISLDK